MSSHDKEVSQFLETISAKNPNEPEFLQAVKEVAETIIPFISGKSKYQDQNILESMCEPERVIMFKVPWQDDQGKRQINREI